MKNFYQKFRLVFWILMVALAFSETSVLPTYVLYDCLPSKSNDAIKHILLCVPFYVTVIGWYLPWFKSNIENDIKIIRTELLFMNPIGLVVIFFRCLRM